MSNDPYDVWTTVRFWQQVIQDSKRTAIVAPGIEDSVRVAIKEAGLEHMVTVRVSPLAPLNQVLIVDEQAMDAELRRGPTTTLYTRFNDL